MFGIDVSYLQVRVNEGALLPTVTLQASVQQSYEQTMTIQRSFGASAIAQLSVPVYQGGAEYALIRQSKETLAQQRLDLEQVRDQTRANVVTAWGQLVAGKAQVQSAQSQVAASEIALNGVREEAKAGQRTTLDVLNAQQALVNARVALVTAQHDRVVASYAVLDTVGRLSPSCSICPPPSTIPACIITRSATAGSVFACPTAADRPRHRCLTLAPPVTPRKRGGAALCLQSIVAMTYRSRGQQGDSRRIWQTGRDASVP